MNYLGDTPIFLQRDRVNWGPDRRDRACGRSAHPLPGVKLYQNFLAFPGPDGRGRRPFQPAVQRVKENS